MKLIEMSNNNLAILDKVAKAIAWTTLTEKGRLECHWEKDFSQGERDKFKNMAAAAIYAYEENK